MKLDQNLDKDPRFRFKTVQDNQSVFSRKEKRKKTKEAKKSRKIEYFSKSKIENKQKNKTNTMQDKNEEINIEDSQNKKKYVVHVSDNHTISKKKQQQPMDQLPQKKVKTESLLQQQLMKDDAEIALLEKKLKLTSKRSQRKVFSDTGFDDNFFNLLTKIHKDVHQDINNYSKKDFDVEENSNENESYSSQNSFQENSQENQDENSYEFQGDEDQQKDESDEFQVKYQNVREDEDMQDDQDVHDEDTYEEFEVENDDLKEDDEFEVDDDLLRDDESHNLEPENNRLYKDQVKQQQKSTTKIIDQKENKNHDIINPKYANEPTISSRALEVYDQEQTLQLQKKLNACFNRLSENNIENIFNQIQTLFQENPKTVSAELTSQIFVKSNIEQNNVLQFLIACNTSLIVALHQIYDNDFFHVVIQSIIKKINIQDFSSTKNITHIFSLLYIFDSITLEFIKSYINFLLDYYTENTIDYLIIVIQSVGMKIRQDNPAILKDLIEKISTIIQNQQNQTNKEKFVLETLYDIRMNKKVKGDPTERLSFLINFLKKGILQKLKITSKQFTLDFQFCLQADFSKRNWWHPLDFQTISSKQVPVVETQNKQLIYLEQKAIEQKFTTDTRKRIFIQIMSSLDFLDATQRLIKLKLPKNQLREIAIVITDCCTQEAKYNPFYGYLSQKLVQTDKQYKFSFQYCIWDHIKLLQNYQVMKIFNLAKLTAFFINNGVHNLGLIKILEFGNLNEQEEMFVKIVTKTILQQFFNNFRNDSSKLGDLCGRVKQNDELMIFRDQFSDYLKLKFLKTQTEVYIKFRSQNLRLRQ